MRGGVLDRSDEVQSRTAQFVAAVQGGLIVSCQALAHEPLYGAEIMARMAVAAAEGGAVGIRANFPADVAAIRQAVALPLVGLFKEDLPGYPVYITPTLRHARAIAEAGADVIALDATRRPRPEPLEELIAAIHRETGLPVLADVADVDDALAAIAAGADMVSTTMSGYTDASPAQSGPDLVLVAELVRRVSVPVLAEGRYHTPEQAAAALAEGATAVVVGGAITRPQEITRRFVARIHQHTAQSG